MLLYRLDRLGRDPRLILNAVDELEALGVQVRSMTEPFDTSSPSGRFTLTILSGVAGLERETILQRMSEGMNRAVKEGAWTGVVPYGYRRVGERRHARLVVSDEPIPGFSMSEKDVVLQVYRMYIEEQKSCIQVAVLPEPPPHPNGLPNRRPLERQADQEDGRALVLRPHPEHLGEPRLPGRPLLREAFQEAAGTDRAPGPRHSRCRDLGPRARAAQKEPAMEPPERQAELPPSRDDAVLPLRAGLLRQRFLCVPPLLPLRREDQPSLCR